MVLCCSKLAYIGYIERLDENDNMKADRNLLYEDYEVSFLDLLTLQFPSRGSMLSYMTGLFIASAL